MEEAVWHFLLSETGQTKLAELAALPLTEHNHLQVASRLRQEMDSTLAQAAIETAVLRQRATAKFSRASQMYFTRAALEQASAEVIATHRAQRFFTAGVRLIADLGCGTGGDALALAEQAHVIGLDRDWLRLAMARENMRTYGRDHSFEPVQVDLTEIAPLAVEALFFDPARRDAQGRRLRSVRQYQPPLDLLDRWLVKATQAAVKISPGVDYQELPEDVELEFISVAGDVREGVLWFGDLRGNNTRRATLLPQKQTVTDLDAPGARVAVTPPGAFLYEPDGAVIRAHLVQHVARQIDATQIDETIAYLTSNTLAASPFARAYSIEAWFPFQLKRLRAYLRAQQVGDVVVKKRGSPLDPVVLRKQLRLSGSETRVLFLTHVLGEPAVLIGQAV